MHYNRPRSGGYNPHVLPSHISQLLAPFLDDDTLGHAQLDTISTYIDLLLHWNARINLTSVRDPEQIVTRHFGESLFAARHLFPLNNTENICHPERSQRSASRIADAVEGPFVERTHPAAGSCEHLPSHPDVILSAESVLPRKTDSSEGSMHYNPPRSRGSSTRPGANIDLLDLGSGAGFPGLPIKIWAPHLTATLIESNQKKATFLREVCRATTLTNVNVVASRAESCSSLTAATVTMRAVERFESALPLARRFVAPDGRLALLIGTAQLDRARQLLANLAWSDPVAIPLSTSRSLLIGSVRDA